MLSYHLWIKYLHVTCVALTFASFVLRGLWLLRRAPVPASPRIRAIPHIIDSLLFGSGLLLALNLQQYPLTHAWLTAKFAALLVYIALGAQALKYKHGQKFRVSVWLAALAVFFYIVSVALNRRAFF